MCSRRYFLLFVCSLQLITAIERQVFDFFGQLWVPILINFFHMIFILFGIFGAYLYKGKYLVTYSVWNILWLGWNTFLICFYLNIGILDRDRNSDILNFGTGSVSWFESNGPGCKPIYPTNATLEDPFRPIRPERVDGCLLDYQLIEVIQSSVQSFFALLGLIGAICIGCILCDDDDSFEFMGNDIKSPQHTSVHPMYVSYSTIPPTNNGSPSSTTKINPQQDFQNNQFGVVLTSINLHSNTNSLSSTYLRTHKFYPPQTSSSNINSPARSHQFTQSPTTHYKLIDQRQLSSSSSLNNQYNSRQNLINKSASTQQIIKRNPSFTSSPVGVGAGIGNLNNVTGHRSDIRYTEIISATDEILMNDDRDVDANSVRSYGRPSSQASTAAASPIITNKLLATNLQQQQLISKSFGIHSNPLSNLVHNNGGEEVDRLILRGSRQQLIDYEQKSKVSKDSPALPPPVPQHRIDYSQSRCLSPSQLSLNNKGYHNSPLHQHNISSPQEKFAPLHHQQFQQFQQHQQFVAARSPNLNHMSKRRQSHHQQPPPFNALPPHQPLESSSINTTSRTPKVGLVHREQFDNIRDRPLPPIPRYNLNQFIPEYNCPNPLPAIPPHMLQHPMYRVRSQDRISNRLKRQTGVSGNHERPRSFCNNMINYQDYKDM